jgi:hypothetical protein
MIHLDAKQPENVAQERARRRRRPARKKQKNRKKNSRTSPQAGAPASPSQVVPERAPQQELKKAVAKPSHLLTALKIRKAVHTNL